MAKNKSVKHTVKDTHCCGCRLCEDVCPQKCISFKEDSEGFLMPNVNEDLCTNCGLCSYKCPELNLTLYEESPFVFSAYAKNKEDHDSGSSGGFFATIAKQYLKTGGVVYGAAFDERLKLRHICADSINKLFPLCKSKYLQSDCKGCYNKVKADLLVNKDVLFVGTPCQCQALSNFIPKELRNKLLIVDFVCHGVSNQKLFDENLKWYKESKGIIVDSYQFRVKDKSKYHHSFLIEYNKSGKLRQIKGTYYKDPYYYGYEKRLILRESCYSCRWASTRRCSDITISDFWGIEHTGLPIDEKYVSCIIANTVVGNSILSSIRESLLSVYRISIGVAAAHNDCLRGPSKRPPVRDVIFNQIETRGYKGIVSTYLRPRHKYILDLYYSIPNSLRRIIRKYINR